MLEYWVLYSIPALLVLYTRGERTRFSVSFWIVLALFFAFVIGFRYHVGGDWYAYLRHYRFAVDKSLFEVLATARDPGYEFIDWLMARWDLGIYGVNLLCGVIFITGLIMFCRQLPDPLLAFAIAVPYLVIVVAMGYTRQGVALGLLFWAISYLDQGKFWQYIALIAIGALFHKTVLIMIPFGVFIFGEGKLIKIGAALLFVFGLWDALVAQDQERLWTAYVEEQMVSEGAKIRVFMNVVPSLLLLLFWNRWKEHFPNHWYWFWMAVASLASLGLVDYASTAVDRMALYFAPIQLAVYSRLAHLPLLPGRQFSPEMVTVTVILAYAAVLYVWLNYGGHAMYWVPYKNIIFQ